MRRFGTLLLTMSLGSVPASLSTIQVHAQGELLYSPDRFMQTPSLHPGFRLESPGARASAPDTETAGSSAPDPELPASPVQLRAGIVEEVIDEPGRIRPGTVMWALERSVTGEPLARGRVQISKADALELTVARRHPADGALVISVTTAAGLGFEPATLATPRLRRTAAAEGEPLFGRVRRLGQNQFAFETSDQSLDAENNVDRLLTRPWLDLIFRATTGNEIIVTLELGRSGAAILKAAIR